MHELPGLYIYKEYLKDTIAQMGLDGGNRMAITVNIYYSGTNGNARKFAEEMVSSGIVNDIRAEDGNIRYEYFSQ